MPTSQEKSSRQPVDSLGSFEQWLLTAVMTLGPNRAYGMTIHEEVERLSKRPIVSLGAIYTAIDRLEKKGFVTSKFADATTDRGGRPRRYVEITAAGQRALHYALDQAAAMTAALRPAEA
jgi:PadR family transcriptional regulator, regulatory protein PadR